MLWYWILGMTDMIVHNRLPSFQYSDDLALCNVEVQRLN